MAAERRGPQDAGLRLLQVVLIGAAESRWSLGHPLAAPGNPRASVSSFPPPLLLRGLAKVAVLRLFCSLARRCWISFLRVVAGVAPPEGLPGASEALEPCPRGGLRRARPFPAQRVQHGRLRGQISPPRHQRCPALFLPPLSRRPSPGGSSGALSTVSTLPPHNSPGHLSWGQVTEWG